MAKNVKINKVTYNDVSSVSVPLSAGGGNALFMETSDATAVASDVAVGATAYAGGAKVVGTLDISGKADKVSGATNNNFASLDGSGNLKDSGKKAADFEDSGAVSTHNTSLSAHGGIYHRWNCYQDSETWLKILEIPVSSNNCTVRIICNSVRSAVSVRGSWEMIISASSSGARADLVYATGRQSISDIDVRMTGTIGSAGAVISIFHYVYNSSPYTYEALEVRQTRTITPFANEIATPSGTVIAINWSTGGSLPLTGGTLTGQLEAPTMRATSDTDASLSSTGHAFQVGSTDKANIAMDGNEIMARNNGAASILYLNADGGDVRVNGKSVYKAEDTIPIADGGTGATTVAGARNALGLGNTSEAVPVANGGTGSTTAANARTALGIRTFSGNCTIVTSGTNYGVISLSGVTTSSIVSATVRTSQPGIATGWGVYSAVPAANQVTIYFNHNSSTANINISVSVIAIG